MVRTRVLELLLTHQTGRLLHGQKCSACEFQVVSVRVNRDLEGRVGGGAPRHNIFLQIKPVRQSPPYQQTITKVRVDLIPIIPKP